MKRIIEAKEIVLYKKLLQVLGDYSTRVPATGIDRLFDIAIEQGKKILPSDKLALNILDFILNSGSTPSVIQKLLNMRLSDLPVECRPMIKVGKKHEVAFWVRDNEISDKVKDLIDFQATGKAGKWGDLEGESVQLLDLSKEKD